MALLVTSEYTKDLYGPNVAYTSFGKDKSSCQTIDSQGWVGGAHGGTMGEMIKTKKPWGDVEACRRCARMMLVSCCPSESKNAA